MGPNKDRKKQNDENKKTDFCHSGRGKSNPRETEHGGNQGNHKKDQRPTQHLASSVLEIGLDVTGHRLVLEKKGNWTAVSLGHGQVQNHTAELVFYGRSLTRK